MNDSILVTVKQMLGITDDLEAFDTDLIVHINSAFMVLNQLGVGPKKGYSIESKQNTWAEYTKGQADYALVKTYVFLKVKLLFDPPASSTILDSYKKSIEEHEFRLNAMSK